MSDRFMLRTAIGQEYFSTKEDLLIRVSGLLDSESSIGMYLQKYPAVFGDAPDRQTGAVVAVGVDPEEDVVLPAAEPTQDMLDFEYRAA